jgi:hypothetical protein
MWGITVRHDQCREVLKPASAAHYRDEKIMINFSDISSWIWIIGGLVLVIIILRFFFHIVVQIFHFVMNFFWHGCVTVIILLVLYYVLRAMGVF